MLQASRKEIVKVELDPPSQEMAVVAGATTNATKARVEFGLGYEQLGRGGPQPKQPLNEESKSQFLQAYNLEPSSRGAGVPFVSLATQDFLQPLERGVREATGHAAPSSAMNGDLPLQLSSRADRNEESRMQFQNLKMQYHGYIETPHPHVVKSGIEASQQSGTNRHWQQQQQQQGILHNASKRARSAQSEGDETDDGDRRKIQREGTSKDDANSRSIDIKGNTTRSKHSATEQRRRSKINDRFQMLRDLLPYGDQKRDKASFLLEVIEYIQGLQDKVKRFETAERGRHSKPVTWDANTSAADVTNKDKSPSNLPDGGHAKARTYGPAVQSSSIYTQGRTRQAQPVVEDLTGEDAAGVTTRERASTSQAANKSIPDGKVTRTREESRNNSAAVDAKESLRNVQQHKLPVKQGLISLSTEYSQRLLESLTTALQSSGLDLSKANLSVQIELGKPSEAKSAAEPPLQP